jgi:hypothetical protein
MQRAIKASQRRPAVDSEYYTADYKTKDQPHANNLLQTIYGILKPFLW